MENEVPSLKIKGASKLTVHLRGVLNSSHLYAEFLVFFSIWDITLGRRRKRSFLVSERGGVAIWQRRGGAWDVEDS